MEARIILLIMSFSLLEAYPTTKQDVGYFWHVTDMHWDPTYRQDQPGGSCSDGTGSSLGTFGDYLCDPPWKLINSSVHAMKQIHPDPDFLIWTGDDTPHIYNDTLLNQEVVYTIISNLTDILQQVFPNHPFYSALGNHDWSPKSQLPPGPDPFYGRIADKWQDWLTDSTADSTFRKGGYYTVKINGTNLRMVVLNTNMYYDSNLLTENMPDPANQLQWMDDVMTQAAQDNEKVIVIGHVPPGVFEKHRHKHWFYPFYNQVMMAQLEKHSASIGGVHMAHHHTDSFRILYDLQGKPLTPIYLAPAVTPWATTLSGVVGGAANNPSIRLIQYNRLTGTTLDIHQYYLSLPEANAQDVANWILEYNGTQYYQQPDMGVQSLHNIAQDMQSDETLFDKYYLCNGVSYSPDEVCRGECKYIHICAITQLDYDLYDQCLQEHLDTNIGTRLGPEHWRSIVGVSVWTVVISTALYR